MLVDFRGFDTLEKSPCLPSSASPVDALLAAFPGPAGKSSTGRRSNATGPGADLQGDDAEDADGPVATWRFLPCWCACCCRWPGSSPSTCFIRGPQQARRRVSSPAWWFPSPFIAQYMVGGTRWVEMYCGFAPCRRWIAVGLLLALLTGSARGAPATRS